MSIRLEFVEDTARFRYPPEYDTSVEELDRLLDKSDTGRIAEKRYIDGLQKLVKRYPWFVDAHAHIGNALLNDSKAKRALDT